MPWPGPVAYRENDSQHFVGREADTETLASLIRTYNFVLLHAPSGAGKSSLVNAAVIPRLRADGYRIIGPGRVLPRQVQTEALPNPYANAFLHSIGVDPAFHDGLDGFAGYLIRESSSITDAGDLRRTLVVFDQFEEVLSLCDDYAAHQRHLMRSVGEAVLVRDNLTALFLVRDDQLGPIMRLGRNLPTDGFPARMHLDSIRAEDAARLLTEPAKKFDVALTEDVVRSVVAGAAQERYAIETENGNYRSYETTSEHVGLVTLQVAARSLWETAEGAQTIDAGHLAAIGDVAGAVGSYYDKSIAEAAAASAASESELRDIFENELISSNDQRQLFPVLDASEAVGDTALEVLEQRAVVRRLAHGPGYYELCHDSFIKPVRKSNQAVRRNDRKKNSRRNKVLVLFLLGSSILMALGLFLDWLETREREIAIGETKPDSISYETETDAFTVELTAGQTVRVRVEPRDDLNPVVNVQNPVGEHVTWDAFSTTSRKQVIFRSGEAGVYRINVFGVGESTGDYDISVDSFTPESIEIGQRVTGSLVSGEVDAYEIVPEGAALVGIRLMTGEGTNGILELTKSAGTPIASQSWPGTNEVLIAELVGSDSFRILVRALDGDIDQYSLIVDTVEPERISVDGPAQPFSIDVEEVQVFEVSAGTTDGLVSIDIASSLDLAAMHWVPDAEALTSLSSLRRSHTEQEVLVSNLAGDLDHLVVVWSMSDEAGTGEIELRTIEVVEPSTDSSSVLGVIESAKEVDAYAFATGHDPDAELIATVLVPAADFDGMLYSGSATGRLSFSDEPSDGGTEIIVSQTDASGTKLAAVAGFEGDLGEYELFAMAFDAVPVDVGDRVDIDRSGQRFDVAVFSGDAAQRVDIDAAGRDVVLVHSRRGIWLPEDDGSYELDPLASAQYYVFVDGGDDPAGDAELRITDLDSSP